MEKALGLERAMGTPMGKVSEVLKSLMPKDQEDLSVLCFVVGCAQWFRSRSAELTVWMTETGAQVVGPDASADIQRWVASLPDESRRHFHGLMEALDIYQSINGEPLAVQNLTLTDKSVRELKQIKDMCLEEGLRSIY